MSLNDAYIVMPRDAVAKIVGSELAGGSLGLRRSPADDMYVVRSVETAKDTRFPVDVPREYAALLSGGPSSCGPMDQGGTERCPHLPSALV